MILSNMRRGDKAVIESIDGNDALVQRLMEMGMITGDQIEVLGFAPLGDPMMLRLRDFRLSLRVGEAACVTVRPLTH